MYFTISHKYSKYDSAPTISHKYSKYDSAPILSLSSSMVKLKQDKSTDDGISLINVIAIFKCSCVTDR